MERSPSAKQAIKRELLPPTAMCCSLGDSCCLSVLGENADGCLCATRHFVRVDLADLVKDEKMSDDKMRVVDLTDTYEQWRTRRKQELLAWYAQLQEQGQQQGKTPAEIEAEALAQLQGNLRELALLTEALG